MLLAARHAFASVAITKRRRFDIDIFIIYAFRRRRPRRF